MTRTEFPRLLSPLRVGQTTLRNRVIMGSMHTRMEHGPDPVARQAAFYAERARGGVAMIVTGGFSPNAEGLLEPGGPMLATGQAADMLRPIVDAVHAEGAKFLLQILHAGRYAHHDDIVGASAIASPINPRTPRRLTAEDIERTIGDFVRCAELAARAGFDGVEVMGSEGYLINQFTAPRTNDRDDEWGGSIERRIRFPVEIVRRMRARLGRGFLIMYRISALDLVEGGLTGDEIDLQARAIEQAGADVLNTGIGWHEARVPTIAYMVPRAAWRFAPARLKRAVSIPVVASNRINTPAVAEAVLEEGAGDLVSMARPLLADPAFVAKAASGRTDDINVCIACNQACLDFIFSNRIATCLVNPRACREAEYDATPPARSRNVAVVGAGPAGLACAVTAAGRGHRVTLYEASPVIGGQLDLARRIPGKQEFDELLRYYRRQLAAAGVDVRLGVTADTETLRAGGHDRVVIATGVTPRIPALAGIDHPRVASYDAILDGRVSAGRQVVIIGTGGIAHDVAEFLLHGDDGANSAGRFHAEWGVDPSITEGGGLRRPARGIRAREITLVQRSPGRAGERLGVSTGWILRARLRAAGVQAISGCTYECVDDAGLHVVVDGAPRLLPADTVVICAGQESRTDLADGLRAAGIPADVIGGAERAAELDALRAIDQGTRLALAL